MKRLFEVKRRDLLGTQLDFERIIGGGDENNTWGVVGEVGLSGSI